MSKSNGSGKEIHEPKVFDPLNNPEFNQAVDKVVDEMFAKPAPATATTIIRAVVSATTRFLSRFFKFLKRRVK